MFFNSVKVNIHINISGTGIAHSGFYTSIYARNDAVGGGDNQNWKCLGVGLDGCHLGLIVLVSEGTVLLTVHALHS